MAPSSIPRHIPCTHGASAHVTNARINRLGSNIYAADILASLYHSYQSATGATTPDVSDTSGTSAHASCIKMH
eukprot:365216-Chlamydomonas_euryale.AAC.10